jgi:hypothetical protein
MVLSPVCSVPRACSLGVLYGKNATRLRRSAVVWRIDRESEGANGPQPLAKLAM